MHGFTSIIGSKVRHKVIKAWKKLVKCIEIIEPINCEEVINMHLRWALNYIGRNFGFSLNRGQHLAKKGLLYVADLWNYEHDRF